MTVNNNFISKESTAYQSLTDINHLFLSLDYLDMILDHRNDSNLLVAKFYRETINQYYHRYFTLEKIHQFPLHCASIEWIKEFECRPNLDGIVLPISLVIAHYFRAEVPIDRFAEHVGMNEEGKPCVIASFKDRSWCAMYGFEGCIESGVKATLSGVLVLVATIAKHFFGSLWNVSMWKDMTKTYADSTWRCAVAIFAPNKTLASASSKIGCSEESLKVWGTSFDKKKTTYAQMLFLGRHAQA